MPYSTDVILVKGIVLRAGGSGLLSDAAVHRLEIFKFLLFIGMIRNSLLACKMKLYGVAGSDLQIQTILYGRTSTS